MDDKTQVKEILKEFLKRSVTTSDDLHLVKACERNATLSQDIFAQVSDFVKGSGDDLKVARIFSELAAFMGRTVYMHMSPAHQRYIALYTACAAYIDDAGSRHIEALAEFSRRFATGEKHLCPALEVLAGLLRQSYDLWPKAGADAIICSTLMGITALHLECTTNTMAITPQATLWPNYVRERTGAAAAYAHFNFMKEWRSTPDSYMQILPYIEFFINGCNDVLSFYKEELCGETANYVHIRAVTDELTPVDTLRRLADETLACQEKIRVLIGEDRELMAIWRSFEQVRDRTIHESERHAY
ncbi:terpene synthase [Ganoderma sinense ZZ0214-1]|uniref:Terpene synthase n=1 Tax=Ganoderma sinense ZZ0214-1 TaxID=1077348 RepID=A0A2G8SI60_9APHY|nr:terpene synthase [Ganoderma sinense ZZ0214-1]